VEQVSAIENKEHDEVGELYRYSCGNEEVKKPNKKQQRREKIENERAHRSTRMTGSKVIRVRRLP